jgi:signal transduction histidine kinase
MDGSNIEGTGIGLTISRHLIERLGGNLDFDSKADESSACWLEQPITSR